MRSSLHMKTSNRDKALSSTDALVGCEIYFRDDDLERYLLALIVETFSKSNGREYAKIICKHGDYDHDWTLFHLSVEHLGSVMHSYGHTTLEFEDIVAFRSCLKKGSICDYARKDGYLTPSKIITEYWTDQGKQLRIKYRNAKNEIILKDVSPWHRALFPPRLELYGNKTNKSHITFPSNQILSFRSIVIKDCIITLRDTGVLMLSSDTKIKMINCTLDLTDQRYQRGKQQSSSPVANNLKLIAVGNIEFVNTWINISAVSSDLKDGKYSSNDHRGTNGKCEIYTYQCLRFDSKSKIFCNIKEHAGGEIKVRARDSLYYATTFEIMPSVSWKDTEIDENKPKSCKYQYMRYSFHIKKWIERMNSIKCKNVSNYAYLQPVNIL